MNERKKSEFIKIISEIILRFNPSKNNIITVTDLKLPKKGGVLKVYLSVFPEKEVYKVIDYLNLKQKTIIKEFKKNMYVKYLPSRVIFYPSFVYSQAEKVLKLINEKIEKD